MINNTFHLRLPVSGLILINLITRCKKLLTVESGGNLGPYNLGTYNLGTYKTFSLLRNDEDI